MVKGILPLAPVQVLGFVGVPAVKVEVAGSLNVLVTLLMPVQPPVVTEKPEKVPSGKLPKVNAPLTTVIVCGLPDPV